MEHPLGSQLIYNQRETMQPVFVDSHSEQTFMAAKLQMMATDFRRLIKFFSAQKSALNYPTRERIKC